MAFITFGDFVSPILKLLAGLGAFLIGVKIMSDSMSRLTNAGMRKMFAKIDSKRIVGVGIGAATTAIIQSSAVTTVMVIGFVNAGIMSLYQATAVIMGANIGTTVTAQLAALQTFDFMQYVVILAFAGFLIMSIAKTERTKTVGYMIAGLGLIFLALEFMSSAMKPFTDPSSAMNKEVQGFLASISNPFLLLLLGIVLTFVLQSSSALTTIIIVMASSGLIIGGVSPSGGVSNGALFVILGSNIGTCFTTLMATAGTSTNAKRSAAIHLLFNLFGSVIFFVLLIIWQSFMEDTLNRWFDDAGTQIAMFHTLFNTVCTFTFLPFTKFFVKFATWILPDKKTDQTRAIMYIDDRFLATPAIAIAQATKEARHIGDMVMETCDLAFEAFLKQNIEAESVVSERLQEITEVNQRLIQYMVNISAHRSSTVKDEAAVSDLYYVMGDILRIGDLAHNITKYTRKIASGEVTFSQSVYPEIHNMYGKIKTHYSLCLDCFVNKDLSSLKTVEAQENEIDELKKELVKSHIARLNNGECNPASNGVYVNLVGNIERMADHMTYIAESITKKSEEIKSQN